MSDQWVELSEMLVNKTKSGDLKWEMQTVDDGFNNQEVIATDIADFEITLSRGISSYTVSISDGSLDDIDSFTDDDLTSLGFPGYFGEFDAIFRMARREAKGAPKAVAAILKELKK